MDEISELYKIFKVMDDSNEGVIRYKNITSFLEEMYIKDGVQYTMDDVADVHAKFNHFQR